MLVFHLAAQSGSWQEARQTALQSRASGRYLQAKQQLTELLQQVRSREPGSLLVAQLLDDLGATEQDLGKPLEAESLLTNALSILKKAGETSGFQMAMVKSHLGELYLEQGRLPEAIGLFRQVLEMEQRAPQTDRANLALAMSDLAMAYSFGGNLREAESLMHKSLGILEAELGPSHPLVATGLSHMAATLYRAKRYDEALPYAERAWSILRQDPTVAEPDLLNTMGSLGLLYSLTGHSADAEYYAKTAAERAVTIYGREHLRTGWYTANYAAVLKNLNRKSEAKAVQKEANSMLATSARQNPGHQTLNASALR